MQSAVQGQRELTRSLRWGGRFRLGFPHLRTSPIHTPRQILSRTLGAFPVFDFPSASQTLHQDPFVSLSFPFLFLPLHRALSPLAFFSLRPVLLRFHKSILLRVFCCRSIALGVLIPASCRHSTSPPRVTSVRLPSIIRASIPSLLVPSTTQSFARRADRPSLAAFVRVGRSPTGSTFLGKEYKVALVASCS